MRKPDMVAGGKYFRFHFPVLPSWFATYPDRRAAFDQPDLAHQHQRPELSFMNLHSRRKIFYRKTAVLRGEFRTQYIGIGNIILVSGIIFLGGAYLELHSLFFIES